MVRAKATIHDVARAVGVHASTVSRVMNPNRRHMVTTEMARRVIDAATSLGYHPNALAHGLRMRRSSTVGVLIPDITNPIFPLILRGIEDALGPLGYTAIIANTDGDAARDALTLELMLARRVDGFILATARRHDPVVARCVAEDLPVVLINRMTSGIAGITAVVNEDARGVALAVAHLVGLGHRRIAHLAGPQHLSTGRERLEGFIAAMTSAGLVAEPGLIATAPGYNAPEGERAMGALLDGGGFTRGGFTAVVVANDLLAIGCYDALAARGLRCPADLSITGYNDMPFVDRLSPPLTTIRIQHYEMGVRAARLLLERLADPGSRRLDIKLEPSLVIRGSTARPP
jgi:LacI family transcriptional regulator